MAVNAGARVIVLEDEIQKWDWLEDEMRLVCSSVEIQSDPVPMAGYLRRMWQNDPEFAKTAVLVIDVLITHAEVVEDWDGKEWIVETPDIGAHFFELFLRHKGSPYRTSPCCFLSQRRLDDHKIQNMVSRIDENMPVNSSCDTRVFSKMVDSDVKDFLAWLQRKTGRIGGLDT